MEVLVSVVLYAIVAAIRYAAPNAASRAKRHLAAAGVAYVTPWKLKVA